MLVEERQPLPRATEEQVAERPARRLRPGNPCPLGATWDGKGVNFAIFSENTTGVELVRGDTVPLLMNAYHLPLRFRLPKRAAGRRQILVDTRMAKFETGLRRRLPGRHYVVGGRSLVLLK